MIRLYGHLQGSFRTVSEGLKLAFEELGVLEGYVIGEAQDFDSDPIPGATAPVAVVVGDPLRTMLPHTQGDHAEVWLMLAPNSEGIPPQLKQQLQMNTRRGVPCVSGFLAPSLWAKTVLKKEFPAHPVELCRHGVLPSFRVYPELRQQLNALGQGHFRGMHMTSTRLGRKCTRELIRAWAQLNEIFSVEDCQLTIWCNPQYVPELLEEVEKVKGAPACVTVKNGQNYSFEDWAKEMSQVHVVVQPSRAEGFGLVPLEAAACGVPSVITRCTGHSEYTQVADPIFYWAVPHGELEPSDDFWGARAPSVSEEGIHGALIGALCGKQLGTTTILAEQDAARIQRDWTWAKGAQHIVSHWKGKYV